MEADRIKTEIMQYIANMDEYHLRLMLSFIQTLNSAKAATE